MGGFGFRGGCIVLALAAAFMTVFSVYFAHHEAKAAQFSLRPVHENFEVLSAGEMPMTRSIYGRRSLLFACDDVLSGRLGSVLPESDLRNFATRCGDEANSINRRAPTWAFPMYVSAVAIGHLGQSIEASAKLSEAQRWAPNESWLAERRVLLGFRLISKETELEISGLERDLATLMQSSLGREFLAKLFVTRPEFRKMIADLADSSDEADQADFLSKVRRERMSRS